MQKKTIPIALLVLSLIVIPTLQNYKAFAEETVHYNTGRTTSYTISSSATNTRIFIGEEITATSSLIGLNVNKASVTLAKSGSPTGTVRFGIWSSSSQPTTGNYIQLIGSFDASSLTSSFVAYTFTFSEYTLGSGQMFGVLYDNGGSGAHHINIGASTNSFNSTSTRLTIYDENIGFTDTTEDLTAQLILVESTDSSGNNSPNICPNGTVLDCVSGSGGALSSFTGGQNPATTVHTIGSGLGILNGTDTNAETNGSGLFLWLFLMLGSGGFMVVGIASVNRRFGTNIPMASVEIGIFFLAVVVATTTIAFYINWIPDIIFYVMVVGIAGFFAFGMFGQLRGRN